MNIKLDEHFPRYEKFDPKVPVWCVTPEIDGAYHRFFDTSPLSPSGRYLALTKMPCETSTPQPGDIAEVILIDLHTGCTEIIAETLGWDTQLGAQAQWGKDDSELFFNDLDPKTWQPYGIKMNPINNKKKKLEGTVYMVSQDGKYALSPCLLRTSRTQLGYGVIVPQDHIPINDGASEDDGIFITNTETGKKRLLVSIKEIVESTGLKEKMQLDESGSFYGAHVKWNLEGTRIMFVLRYKTEKKGKNPQLITTDADGSNIKLAIPFSEWNKGGHHPNWHSDGQHVMMNLKKDGEVMRLIQAFYDGSGYRTMSKNLVGSGHPSINVNGKTVITDSYIHEPFAFDDGTTPIRLLDLEKDKEQNLIRIRTQPEYQGVSNELRVDPHPAWGRDFRYIVFNACPNGKRKVYIADLIECV